MAEFKTGFTYVKFQNNYKEYVKDHYYHIENVYAKLLLLAGVCKLASVTDTDENHKEVVNASISMSLQCSFYKNTKHNKVYMKFNVPCICADNNKSEDMLTKQALYFDGENFYVRSIDEFYEKFVPATEEEFNNFKQTQGK